MSPAQLQLALDEAIQAEKYEAAAIVRDVMKKRGLLGTLVGAPEA